MTIASNCLSSKPHECSLRGVVKKCGKVSVGESGHDECRYDAVKIRERHRDTGALYGSLFKRKTATRPQQPTTGRGDVMWRNFKCHKQDGENRYMGFAELYDNVVTYLLEKPSDVCLDYDGLISHNRETFDRMCHSVLAKEEEVSSRGNSVQIKLVEPRELVYLLNYIETNNSRLCYAPRPFYRSNVHCLTTLVHLNESSHTLACLICGKASVYCIGGRFVVFNTGSVHFFLDAYTLCGGFFNNDLDPGQRPAATVPVPEMVRHLHHERCPVMWLHDDRKATWNFKHASVAVATTSKFHQMMQFLTTYPRPRENVSWLCLLNRLARCSVPGATRETIEAMFRIIVHERLSLLKDQSFQGRSPAKIPLGMEMIFKYGPGPGSGTTVGESADSNLENVASVFSDGTISHLHYYRLVYLHGFLVSPVNTNEHACLYCGAMFQNVLSRNFDAAVYYTGYQMDCLIRYALYGARTRYSLQYAYGRCLTPVQHFQTLLPKDLNAHVLSRLMKRSHQTNERLKRALVWLSSTLDSRHSDDCIFRIRKRTFRGTTCPICLEEYTVGGRQSMVCGHQYCASCYNEVSVTDCCLCRRGYRGERLVVSGTVVPDGTMVVR
ncbi:hypothetical protein J6590_102009 [Homalodisca vitripennis]|nr:hypothetical protein J6590_102009 [Homalodisca vitripennis]